MNTRYISIALLALAAAAHAAAEEARPAFQNLRFEEDWSAFRPAEDAPIQDRIKHMRLSDAVWVSVGGKLRLRLEGWNNANFDRANDDIHLYYRGFLHADWRFGEHLRVFTEVRYSDVTRRDLPGGRRQALDYDRGDVWNLFVEGRMDSPAANLRLRVGRQELQYGRQRLLSPLDWANNRRIFDAALIRFEDPEGAWRLDAFAAFPVRIRSDAFTWNPTADRRLFSGVHYSRTLGERGHAMEAYLFALNTRRGGPPRDDRYTVGMRHHGPIAGNLRYELEGAFQFGARRPSEEAPKQRVRAWMLTAETTYTFAETRWRPWILLGADYASGDYRPGDGTARTFDQLFPLGHAYLGFADMIGRRNIIDLRLSVGAAPIPDRLRVQADLHFFWLAQRRDGLYNVGGGLARSPFVMTEGGDTVFPGSRTVGQEIDLTLTYRINRHANLLVGYSRFFAGNFLKRTGPGKDIDFAYSQIEFTF